MKTFKEFLDESEISNQIEISNNYYAVVDQTKFDTSSINKVKNLANEYDWFTMFIDSYQRKEKEAKNREIVKELKELGVDKLILEDPKAQDKWMQKREVHVKWS